MTDQRLNAALCMMNIHRNRVNDLISNNNFHYEIVDRFGGETRQLQFLYGNE